MAQIFYHNLFKITSYLEQKNIKMGAELSQQRKERPRKPKNGNKADDIVRINRSDSDVPEAYRMVQISDDVFQRIQAANEQKAERIRFFNHSINHSRFI
jgi:hypothetical protein